MAPLFWVLATETTEVLLQTTVDDFLLAVGLWVKRSAHLQLSALEFEKFLPKLIQKNRVTITNYRTWNTVECTIWVMNDSATVLAV